MNFHPIANIFPLLTGDDYAKFKQDIRENGLIEPILLHPDGSILDGRNRFIACQELGIEPVVETYQGDLSALAIMNLVLSLNIHRRHLNSSQQAAIAVEFLPMLEEEAKERQGQRTDISDIREIFPESSKGRARDQAADLLNTNGRYVQDAKKLKEEVPILFEQIKIGEITIPQAKQKVARQRIPQPAITPAIPTRKYRCIVIDPPWPMKKIEREKFPNQGLELDYPTMDLEEIEALPISDLSEESGCHLYLWVTQKFLPAGLQLVEKWGFNYQCLMTWRKNVGFTPFSWMYDTEHVIFARRGNLPLQQLGLRLSFEASTNGHSVKPDIFFNDRVIPASPEPRLEMFARKNREGFEVWGNEVAD